MREEETKKGHGGCLTGQGKHSVLGGMWSGVTLGHVVRLRAKENVELDFPELVSACAAGRPLQHCSKAMLRGGVCTGTGALVPAPGHSGALELQTGEICASTGGVRMSLAQTGLQAGRTTRVEVGS